MPCASMIFTAACATRLMREEIQFEAFAQGRVVDFADAALPGGAGIGDQDVDAAERFRDFVEGARARRSGRSRRIASASAAPPIACATLLRGLHVAIEQRHFGARRCERASPSPRRSRRPPPVMTATWPRERLLRRLAELGLLQRPIFAYRTCPLREIGAKRPIASAAVMTSTACSRRCRRRSPRPSCERAEAEQAEARHQDHPRRRIEHRLDAADARVVAREIVLVLVDEGARPRARAVAEIRRACRRPARAATSGQSLVRMVWSGVTTPACA